MPEETKPTLVVGTRYAFPWEGRNNDLALFAALGAAVAEVQSFECHVIAMLGAIHGKVHDHSFYTRTLGVLIKTLSKSFPDSDVGQLLEDVRTKRNRLVHSFLREYQWPMMNDVDYVRAIQDLESTRSFIEKAGIELSRYLSDRSLVDLIVVRIDHETEKDGM